MKNITYVWDKFHSIMHLVMVKMQRNYWCSRKPLTVGKDT